VSGAPKGMSAAPLFPSQVKEGQPGGGYDVELDFVGSVLFLQFKLSDQMYRRTAVETKKKKLDPPFFRMHLRSSAKSDQHKLLLKLEAKGNRVLYAAPKFTSAVDLNDAYLKKEVVQRTAFFRPSGIGPLPNQKEHWVAFKPGHPVAYFLSGTPRPLQHAVIDGSDFLAGIAGEEGGTRISEDTFARMRNAMQDVVLETVRERNRGRGRAEVRRAEAELEAQFQRHSADSSPHRAVGYLARTFFGAQAIYIRRDTHAGPEL
jgi:C-terminal processing protease CtpA/Prc